MRRDERGVAALELAIFMSVLMVLAFGALPLYAMLRGYQRVSKASASTLRYATAVDSNTHRNTAGTLTRRRSYDEIAAFAREAADDQALDVEVAVCKAEVCTDVADRTAPIPAAAGDTVRLTIRAHVDLSVLGRVANAASRLSGGDPVFPENDVTVTSTASARQE